ncbi:hypothetical protein ABW20_dc0101226 [Dactylellina cionopaga]|nr:hypothetical protein ABW20_dc0101226 [Dactylellina cionopaga]
MGKTGKSVARSYLAALDLLVPVEASVSGMIAGANDAALDPRRKIIKDRYDSALKYLQSSEEGPSGGAVATINGSVPKSKLERYVQKQEFWAHEVEKFTKAQIQHQDQAEKKYPGNPARQREEFNQWVQANSRDAMESPDFYATVSEVDATKADTLRNAYTDCYKSTSLALAKVAETTPFNYLTGQDPAALKTLTDAQSKWNEANREANAKSVKKMGEQAKDEAMTYLQSKVTQIQAEIDWLTKELNEAGRVVAPRVISPDGTAIEDTELKRDHDLLDPPVDPKSDRNQPDPEVASPWTKVSCKVSFSSSSTSKGAEETESQIAAKLGLGWLSASAGATHSSSTSKSISCMDNLEVEISMECMVVNIERPWLHAELFNDFDLDVGKDFPLSPGEGQLLEYAQRNEVPKADYQQFSSYPTAFVIASNVELGFSGDTSSLESSLEASSSDANASVGVGPFSCSASHKSSKSKSKTRTETTATGMKISLQAPQIIAWVQTLLPKLPRGPKPV